MTCNILLMGMTGVGKSSLINYLAGENLAEAGIGYGSGGLTRGIHKYPIFLNGQSCLVSDSEGLETGKSEFWKNLMENELFSADVRHQISDWYHIVIYCIGMNSNRIQPFELEILEKLVGAGYGIIVALTKSDLASDDDIKSISYAIQEHFDYKADFRFVPITSVATRVARPEGKDELSEAIIDSWGDSLINRLPDMIYEPIFKEIKNWGIETERWISNQDIGLFGRSKEDVLNDVNKEIQAKTKYLINKVKYDQEKSFRDVRDVFSMLDTIIDSQSIAQVNPEFSSKIENLKSAMVFDNSNIISNSLFATSAALFAVALPLLVIPVAILTTIFNVTGKKRRNAELAQAFESQWVKVFRLFSEQKDAFSYSLGAMIGYLYAYRELAICYLKGRGVQKDYDKAVECLNKIIEYKNINTDFQDSEAEYYIGYEFFKEENYVDGASWLRESAAHGNKKAQRILDGENIDYVEMDDDQKYESYWKHFFDD